MTENILLFHLESVNNQILYNNLHLFPNLKRLLRNSTVYKNYYSSATSTYMVITDLLFGNTDHFESSTNLENVFTHLPDEPIFLKQLKDKGYSTKFFYYIKENLDKMSMFFDNHTDFEWSPRFSKIQESFSKFIQQDKWVAYFIDGSSHIYDYIDMADDYPPISNTHNLYLDRFSKMDKDLGILLNILQQNNKLEETTIILYGDHGDDFLGKGIHNGYFHAIPPYPFITNTPLIVYSPNQEYSENFDLHTTTEIGDFIINDLKFTNTNNFVTCRNLFAAQDVMIDTFNKSYAVYNTNFCLLSTTKGLSMFYNHIDVASGRNLLDFFVISENKISYKKIFNQLRSSHYKAFFNKTVINEIETSFSELLPVLKEYISKKNPSNLYPTNKILYSKDIKKTIRSLNINRIKRMIISIICGVLKHNG